MPPFQNRSRREKELEEEIQGHLRMAEQDRIEKGESPEQAKYAALREFGNLDLVKQTTREMWGLTWLDRLGQDLRYALRQMRWSPGFTLAVVLTLAFGIGVNVAVFSVVNTVLLRPLPFPNADEIVKIMYRSNGVSIPFFMGPGAYLGFQQARSLSDVAAYGSDDANLSGTDGAERISFMRVSRNFFPLLGVQPSIGRSFLDEEDQPGGDPVAILDNGFWKRRFGGDPDIIGRSFRLDGNICTVIGVLPASFDFPDKYSERIDLWMPLIAMAPDMDSRIRSMSLIGRLKHSGSIQAAQAELEGIWETTKVPGLEQRLYVSGWQEEITARARLPLLLFLGAFGFVLLIACVNAANLWLIRIGAREKEIAVRLAIGAKKARILRQLLTEGILITFLGGGLGLGMAFCVRSLLKYIVSENIIRVPHIHMDYRVIVFAFLICLIVSIVVVLAAAFSASRLRPAESLKEGRNSSLGPGFYRTQKIFVVAQVGLAVILLVGAGLFLKSLFILKRIDPGYRPQNVMGMMIDLERGKYPDARVRAAFLQQVLEQIKNLPMVESAALTGNIPYVTGPYTIRAIEINGGAKTVLRPNPGEDAYQAPNPAEAVYYSPVSAGYFHTMGIPLLRGRAFTDQDGEGGQQVAIINETFARRFFADRNPMGQQIRFRSENWATVVGIVGDAHSWTREDGVFPQLYVPHWQFHLYHSLPAKMGLVIRGIGDPMGLVPSIRGVLKRMDPDQAFYELMSLEERLFQSLGRRRATLMLIGASSALALLLACIGIYGIVSYSVSRRIHEIGVRMALGAQSHNIIILILKQAMTSAFAGLLLGLAGAFILNRYISSMLYGVTATDPVILIAISLLVIVVAVIASFLPSRSATRIELSGALRSE